MKLLPFLFFAACAMGAVPDSLRYEQMTTLKLVCEVLGSRMPEAGSKDPSFSEIAKERFPSGEKSDAAWARALAIKKKYPYCVLTTLGPDAPAWSICIFRFHREENVIVGKEEVWINVRTEAGLVSEVAATLTVWDL